MAEKVCKQCSASFRAHHLRQEYCSRKCRLLYHGNGGKAGSICFCYNCGMRFAHSGKNQRHCSPECRKEHQAALRRDRDRAKWVAVLGPMEQRQCPVCAISFKPNDPRQVYCESGGRCAATAYRLSAHGREYFSQSSVKDRQREASRRHYATPHGTAAQRERDAMPHNVARRKTYSESDHGKTMKRLCQRRANTDQAIGNLIIEKATHNV